MINKIDDLDNKYETLVFTDTYALQGDLDTAFMWLEQAAEKGYPRYYFAKPSNVLHSRSKINGCGLY